MQGHEVSAQQGFDYDVLAELGKLPKEPHKLADQCMTTSSLLGYSLGNGYSLLLGKK
ncbi:hypothetical protein QQZ08_002934, partial [Neonectria magnoliae]